MQWTPVQRRQRVIYLNPDFYNHASHKALVRYAVANNWILTCHTHRIDDTLLRRLQHFDGAIVHCSGSTIQRIRKVTDIPIVATSATLVPEVKHVLFDDVAIGRVAARHLMGKGLRRLIMVRSDGQRGPAAKVQRYQGIVQEAGTHKCTEASLLHMQTLTPEYLNNIERPFGVILTNDTLAPEVLFRLADAGLSVPLDVAVLGIDNNPLYCDTASVPLSSIKINAAKRGRIAADFLNQMMRGATVSLDPVYIAPDGIVERASTEMAAIQHQPTVSALQYIRKHLGDSELSVADIAQNSPISRRGLETAFMQHLNRSIASEIHRQRIEWAIDLIRADAKSMAEIATTCGFSSPQSMSRTFRRVVGRTPSSYKARKGISGD